MSVLRAATTKLDNNFRKDNLDSTGSFPRANQIENMYLSDRLIDGIYAVSEPTRIPVPYELQNEYLAWEKLSDEALENFENSLKDEER
jgi:hypothetical protein